MGKTGTVRKFGMAPVYFTAISTILGAILFLRFGFAVGTLGFWGAMLIIVMGHAVTVPTAMAISELATNKRVEGGSYGKVPDKHIICPDGYGPYNYTLFIYKLLSQGPGRA